MRKKWTIITTLLFTLATAQAQQIAENWVYNGSFESYRNCPKKIESLGILTAVNAWYQPTTGSADYFHRCGNRECQVPKNKLGIQEPFDGDAYCGIYCSKNDYREYLQTQLKYPLKAQHKYHLKFYVSLSEYSSASVATIGGLFTTERIADTCRGILVARESIATIDGVKQSITRNYQPQVENPYSRRLDSTDCWQCIEGTFIATGGESYLTIGNFNSMVRSNIGHPDTLTDLLPGAYYYIDAVSVTCLDCDSSYKDAEASKTTYETGSTIVLKNVYFDFNKSILLQQSFNELEKVVEMMNSHPQMKIAILGHTDNQGSDSYNQRLSENRAKAVVDYLESRGIPAKRMRYKGYGKARPIDTNSTESGRANNRRVELQIIEQ